MAVTLRSEPVLLVAAASHWLELESGPPRRYADGSVEPFAKEELHPILELDAPRVGRVRARFSVDRYVSSNWDKTSGTPGTSTAFWSSWRVILREVTVPDLERPELAHLGRGAAGVGDATRSAIREACEPVILAWFETPAYVTARRAAAAFAVKRELHDVRSRGLLRARRTLEEVDAAGALDEADCDELRYALDLLEKVDAALEKVPVSRID